MRNQKITRFVCLFLAMLFLVSTATVAVSANESSGVTDKSIEDYVDELNTILYQEYMSQYPNYFANPNPDLETVRFDTNSNWVFEAKGEKTITVTGADNKEVTLRNGDWFMQVQMQGTDWSLNIMEIYRDEKNEKQERLITTFTSMEAVVEAGIAEKKDLVFLASFGEGSDAKTALYTPGWGSVTWTLDLSEMTAGLYSIELEYYPIYELEGYEDPIAKSSSVEREFYINGEAPFAEARALTLPKIWSSFKADGVSGLTATCLPKKGESVADVIAAAKAAGLEAAPSADGTAAVINQPKVVTQPINEFIAKYNLRFMIIDADNNELRPTMVQTPEWTSYTFHDSEGFYANDFGFVLDPATNNGKLDFTLEGVNESMALCAIVIKPYADIQTYAQYLNNIDKLVGKNPGTGTVKLESEYPYHSSTNVVYPIEDRTSPLTSPADTSRVMLNTIGTEKWATAGQWVEYRFEVDGSGLYDIYSRYRQSYLDGMYVCRSMEIYTEYATAEEYKAAVGNTAGYYNGVPFAEANELRYDYGTGWQVTNLTSGADTNLDGKEDTYQIYFEKDVVYTIRLEVTLGSMSEQVQKIEDILNNLNADYLSIIKLTGTSPDDYRDYSFARLLPETLVNMMQQAFALREVSAFLKETAEVASTYSGTCDKLDNLLTKLVHDPDEIAKNLDNLKSYVGNLGTFLSDAKTQPLQLDYISIQPAASEAPKAEGNFFQTFAHECGSFIQSFFRDYNSMGAMDSEESTETINVWLAYGRDQSQVIRNLTTNEFTPDTAIAVDLKLVSGGTLLPSILAGMGPDVYLGLADETVINYAIRGALNNIEDMDGFNDVVEEYFTRAAMLQLEISDSEGVIHTYGLPETQTFNMMFVRLDILGELGIEIPKTWDDIYVAQSKLESNNMEIGVTTNYKMFLYQDNGDLYADNGMRINLDSVEGLAAFEKMCNMFTQYSFPYKYDAANRFRTGEYPIIIADYTGLYNKLKVFATEIEGSWTFVPVPGTVQADGSINNTADSTIAAVVMISSVKSEPAAWKFMKWYTGSEAQTRYANEMVAIIGDSAKHPTANRIALENMPWTRDEYNEVSKQFENLAAIPNYPGSYYIGRHTNFAFLSAYNDDADPSTELLSYINTINNEITRKREEFKLETLEIGQTLASKRLDQALEAIDALIKVAGETKYAAEIEAAMYGIANERVAQLDDASSRLSAKLEYNYIKELIAVEQDSSLSSVVKTSKKAEIEAKCKDYTFYINVTKQTAEPKNGGYNIDDLSEMQLVYFIAEALRNAADALDSYKR